MDKVLIHITVTLLGTVVMGSIITGIYALIKRRKGERANKKIVLRIFVVTFIFYAIANCISLFFNTPATTQASDKQATTTQINPIVNLLPLIIIIGVVVFFIRANRNKQYGMTGSQITGKRIQETKCTCQACGNVWYYGKQEAREISAQNMANCGNSMSNMGSDMMCCGGCLPAVLIPQRQNTPVKDLNKCPKCNSSAIRKETVIHEV